MRPNRVMRSMTLSQVIVFACESSLRVYDAGQRNYALMHFFHVLDKHPATKALAGDKDVKSKVRGAMSIGREYFERAMRELDPEADLTARPRIRMPTSKAIPRKAPG